MPQSISEAPFKHPAFQATCDYFSRTNKYGYNLVLKQLQQMLLKDMGGGAIEYIQEKALEPLLCIFSPYTENLCRKKERTLGYILSITEDFLIYLE